MTHATAPDLHSRAYQLHLQSRVAEAIPFYQQALALDPELLVGWSNLGLALLSLRQPEEALRAEREALRIDPDSADAQNNLGMIHYAQGCLAEAENAFRSALRLEPGHANAMLNLGSVRELAGHVTEAEALFRHALALGVDPGRGNTNLALALLEQVRPEEAEQCCREALAFDPTSPAAHANRALSLLTMGLLAEGWREYEHRWDVEALGGVSPLPGPRWTGQALNGETVLLWAEQGFGDVLQFCRYVPMVAAAGGRVVLMVPKALRRVMATLEGVSELIAEEDGVLPAFDYHCPLLSLPFAFGTTLETIPAPRAYLAGDAGRWADVLGRLPGLKVGLVWAGKSRTQQPHAVSIDKRRSMRLADMAPLFGVAGCSFVSLQLGPPAEQMRQPLEGVVVVDSFDALPLDAVPLYDVSGRLQDWADTADLVMGLDLVISVDTAVAHLVGALGRPVWMLNRFDSCWRWFLDREDSPWYPSMRQFRQAQRGDWAGVVGHVAGALELAVSARERELE
jgi:Flp pilus assembly protein TadD